MNKYLFFLFFFSFSIGFAQDFKNEWQKVIQFELDGKVKSASEVVDEIYKKAKRKKIEDQVIKCFFYQSKFLQVRNEDYQSKVLERLKSEIRDAKGSQLALLCYIYVDMINDYYQNNRFEINRRTDLEKNNSTDFLTWTKKDFDTEITTFYDELLKEEDVLHETPLAKFSSIFEISPFTDAKNLSVYDFLHDKVIDFYFQKLRVSGNQNYQSLFLKMIESPADFASLKTDTISNQEVKKLLFFFQINENHAFKNTNRDLDVLQYKRMKKFYSKIQNKEKYFAELAALKQKTKNDYLLQDIDVDFANYYFSLTSKSSEKNYYPEVLNLVDSILKKRENPNAKAAAETLKEQILKKKLTLDFKSNLYPNQNYRAFITYKNVDTIKVSYYKIPLEIFKQLENQQNYFRKSNEKYISRDSIVLDYISKNKALKSTLKKLPTKTDHFEYSTEVLMDNLEMGRYLLFFETKNPYHFTQKAFAYKTVQVSDIDYVQQKTEDFDGFTLLERKSGKPIANAIAKNDEITVKSNNIGKVKFPFTKEKTQQYSQLLFIKDNDTLYDSYVKTQKSVAEDEEYFEAKSMVFFDRAIYRPGQKVFFKAYMFQNKYNVKSVVPDLTVRVIIEDANDNEVKSFDIQTNEFGSFTGEYDIPKNILTGNFRINIEEPDNYEMDVKYYNKKEDEHSFWDYVDFNGYRNFNFQVEEYKRPTFEISFDEVKENYTIGDTVTIKGNAKTLAGSNLTNAKVAFSVTKSIELKKNYFDNGQNNSNAETTTDKNGNFKIILVASQEGISAEDIESINFTIDVSITDLNGETQTKRKAIEVGDEMLQVSCLINTKITKKEKNKLIVKATTLNNFPINAKGTITFYEENQEHFLISKERFPELNSIEKEEYEKLFPYEAFERKDIEIVEKKVLTIPFNTEKTTEVDLAFLKNFKSTNYKIVVETKDPKGNEISTERRFELISKVKQATKERLFLINELVNDKNNFVFEIKSVIPNLYVSARSFDGSKEITEEVIQLKNGNAIVKISRKAKMENDQHFHFSTIWEGIYFSDEISVSKEEFITPLDFEIVSMRNKIEPGSTENWSFVMKNTKLQAEVLASMYDTSLDQFATSPWKSTPFYNQSATPEFSHNSDKWYDTSIRFDNLFFNSIYNRIATPEPYFNKFGFSFSGRNGYANKMYLGKIKALANVPKNAKTVYGIVSEDGFPLPGVTVNVEGTSSAVQTDFNGYYEIDIEKGETLVFSFIGFKEAIITYNKEKNINVTLVEESQYLGEVVVVSEGADQIIKTRAQTTVSSVTLNYARNSSVLNSLQGQAKGLNIISSSGSPGSAKFNGLMRGASSISGNTDPLLVIDGIPVTAEGFRNLNQDDIQSVTVLRNKDGVAIYGNRAKNGVIIITTKNELKALEQVKTRTNFNETAFFIPNLLTDSEGNINFSFTTPESLTKWRLRLFGHNKKADTGYFETDIISQKDIMVMPNMPRFVREKDVINLTTKIVNMTNEVKTGNAVLLLFDAATNTAIDSITMNSKNLKVFTCKPKESVVVDWTITIPEGVQGLRYKVIAKSGTTSDGEENILPVLTDKILITESIPIWVKGNTKREFTIENLKNNTSTTLKNQALTFEYTSNPVWIALQSLPYLMTYEHECSEQVFAKYYANCIAEKIISSNPKIEKMFQKWRDEKSVTSKLQMNEELKSIVLTETPWLLDAESDAEKNKRLAVLMDLSSLKENNVETYKKLEEKMLPSGGFPWFSGGSENQYISQHILAGIGRLNMLFPEDSLKYKNIASKGISNLDRQFVSSYSKNAKIGKPSTLVLYNLYTRSFFLKNYPISIKNDSIIKSQLKQCKEDWLTYSLYEKGLLALTMNRFQEKDFAKKIITHLKETVSSNDEIGMYWIENKSNSNWFQSSIATQALLIEAFAEIDKDKETIDAMKVWLIKNKQTNNWPTTKSTTEAVFALMNQGKDWISLKENTIIKMGDEKLYTKKLLSKDDEQQTGYLKIQYTTEEISPKMATVSIENKTAVPGFGSLYWQYFESLANIKKDETKGTSIDKKLFKKLKTATGEELTTISNENLKVGDLLTVRLTIRTDTDLEFVHLKDLRASGLEPVDVISKHEWKGNFSYYKSTKDVATHFFFDQLSKGTYVLEHDLRVTNQGDFNSGISTLQSMYAPEFSAYSENSKVVVGK